MREHCPSFYNVYLLTKIVTYSSFVAYCHRLILGDEMIKRFFVGLILVLLLPLSADIFRAQGHPSPQIEETINIENLTDGNLTTYYVMRRRQKGKNIFIDISLDENKKLLGFYISAGCLADSTSFKKYNKIKSFWLTNGLYDTGIITLPNFLPTFEQFVNSHYAEYEHQFIEPKNNKYEYQAAIEWHKHFIRNNMLSMEKMLVPVILKNPVNLNNVRLFPIDCYERGHPEYLKLSEFSPIYDKSDNIEPNLIRDIANLFMKMRNEDTSIFPSGTDSIVKFDYLTNNSLSINELKEYCPAGDFIPRCILDEQNEYLVVWNGYEEYKENGASEYQFLVFRKFEDNWKLLGIGSTLLSKIFEVMPDFINYYDIETLNGLLKFDY